MRHHLVVNLQPIGMIYEVMERRLRAPSPDLADVHESAHKINGFAKAALHASLDVVTWLAPDAEVLTTATEGVRECLSLVATSLTFRGYALRNEVPELPGQVRRSALRTVLTGAILHLTDEHEAPADLAMGAEAGAQALVLTLALRPTAGERSVPAAASYRRLRWSDLSALAQAESVQVQQDGAEPLRLIFPWAAASA